MTRGFLPGFLILLLAAPASGQPHRRNNLVTTLLETSSGAPLRGVSRFRTEKDGWIFVSCHFYGTGSAQLSIDPAPGSMPLLEKAATDSGVLEGIRYLPRGLHDLSVVCNENAKAGQLSIRSIPELIHCGLGYDPAIRSYGKYDLAFLRKDILPNVTTLIIPQGLSLEPEFIRNWRGQGKRFIAETGIDSQARNIESHVAAWTSALQRTPYADGIIINEFIINNPSGGIPLSPDRQARMKAEQERYEQYRQALTRIHQGGLAGGKSIYTYFGGSGKTLNTEVIGTNFVRALVDAGCRIVPERYLFERSSEEKSREALQEFSRGIADWKAREPDVMPRLVIAFGLFSMPPGGINKLPHVDYHVWMDQQMNVVANDPVFEGLGGLEWWTSLQADEETVRFVGKLYRHYGIEGKKELMTRDPLFMSHLQNADFEKQLESWKIEPAEEGSIQPRSFPRFGRIEGRYMGLGRPADPEHIGDTFLWMKRSAKGPNRFSQTIRHLQPGRLYSMKMFSCDYDDLIHPRQKKQGDAAGFIGNVRIDGVEIDSGKSFREAYASNPEPPIPVWITYHWLVFRARGTTAELTVSDWPESPANNPSAGQEQAFNFLEVEPYWE